MIVNGSFTTPLQHNIACAVPKGFTLVSGNSISLGTLSLFWKTYSTSILPSILLPIVSLNISKFSSFIINITFVNPAFIASYIL